jgi:hypothetical protein
MVDTWLIAVGAVVVALAAGAIWRVQRTYVRKRGDRIEQYLRLQKQEGRDEGRCSVGQLMKKFRLTKGQVLDACRQSPAIMRLATTASFPGAIFADTPVFEYAPLRGRD